MSNQAVSFTLAEPRVAEKATDPASDFRHGEPPRKTVALRSAVFQSASFSSIATDGDGVIQLKTIAARPARPAR